jgi:subfamily B ATP-binding cassette protein MsbA
MINWRRLAQQLSPFGSKTSNRSIARIASQQAAYFPLVAGLGFFASVFETIGIGLLIPLVALAFSGSAPAGLPAPLTWLVSALNGAGGTTSFVAIAVAILALILLKGATQAANMALIWSLGSKIGRDVRNALAARVLDLDYSFFLRNDTSRIVNIMETDSWYVVEAVRRFLTLISAAIGLAIFCAFLFWLEWRLTVVVVASGIAIRASLYLFEQHVRRRSAEVTAANRTLVQRTLAIVNGMRVVRIFGQQALEKRRFADASERSRKAIVATQGLAACIVPSLDVLITTLFLIVILAAHWTGLTLAEASGFVVLLTRAQPQAKAISEARIGIAAVQASVDEVGWLLSQRPERPDTAEPTPALSLNKAIHFRNVSFAYPDGSHAIHNASFTLEPNTVTALIGRSGSGKTTLVNLLTLLVEPQFGEIVFGDRPVKQIDPARWRSRIAIAGQDADILEGTVSEVIAYARPGASSSEIEDAARAANADEFIARLPQGYATRIGYAGINLSGGQRQRLALARALLRDPDLLILDEATSAVDAISEQEMMRLLAERKHFRTALVISHRRSTLAACENGIVLEDGRVLEAGKLRDLAYYRAMGGEAEIIR